MKCNDELVVDQKKKINFIVGATINRYIYQHIWQPNKCVHTL